MAVSIEIGGIHGSPGIPHRRRVIRIVYIQVKGFDDLPFKDGKKRKENLLYIVIGNSEKTWLDRRIDGMTNTKSD